MSELASGACDAGWRGASGQGTQGRLEMTATPRGNTAPDDETAAVIRAAAISEAPRHRRLLQSPRDGRVLSAIMLRVLALSTPPGQVR